MNELTKQAIASSLAKLLQEQSISQITVKDICAGCGVNRQTFYYHYQDIYDLLFWYLKRSIADYFRESNLNPMDLSGYVHALFDFCKKNARIVRHAYNPANRILYETAFRDATEPILLLRVAGYENSHLVSKDDLDLLISFYAFSASSLLFRWIESGMPDSFEASFSKYCVLLDESVNAILLKLAGSSGAVKPE